MRDVFRLISEVHYIELGSCFNYPHFVVESNDKPSWYTGQVHEIQSTNKVGIFGFSDEEQSTGYVYDEHDPSDTGILCNEV